MIIYDEAANFWKRFSQYWRAEIGLLKKLIFGILGVLLILILGIISPKQVLPRLNNFYHLYSYKPQGWYYQITTKPKTIYLDIGFKNYQKLSQKRDEALKTGVLITDETDLVPATLTYEGEQIPIKIRLKGDWADQLTSDKWSFRIEVNGGKTVLGMSRFSLHPPEARNHLNEWIFLQAVKKTGLIALRYDFVNVVINGEQRGIYALEEQFTKELIENNRRREAPILKYNEEMIWDQQIKFGIDENRLINDYYLALIDSFQWSKIEKDPTLKKEFLRSEKLLTDYRQGTLPPDQVFDYEKWATFFALLDLFGGAHAISWQNLRFYYNPLSDRLEPIPFDTMPGYLPRQIMLNEDNPITFPYQTLFKDEKFTELYLKKLGEYINPDFVNSLMGENEVSLKNFERIIRRDAPYQFNPDFLLANQQYLKNKIESPHPFWAYLTNSNGGRIEVEFLAADRIPVKILGLKTASGETLLDRPETLKTIFENVSPQPQKIEFNAPPGFSNDKNIAVVYQYLHQNESRTQALELWPHQLTNLNLGQDLRTIPGVTFDPDNNLYLLKGNITLDKVVNINSGFKILILPNTRLNLIKGGGMISSSPLEIRGDEDNPVTITSSDTSGAGIFVRSAGQESKISHARFSNLRNFNTQSWETTGAVTFYNSPVSINDVIFEDFQSEDMLNIVLSKFSLDHVVFRTASSDAFDTDFGEGEVLNVNCQKTGNDCLDFSGSPITVKNVKIEQAGDKGISVGEKSTVTANDVEVKDGRIGFASKDESYLRVDKIKMENLEYGIVAYQKKPEYGPATVDVGALSQSQIRNLFFIEKKSSMFLYGQRIFGDVENIYNKIYGNQAQ